MKINRIIAGVAALLMGTATPAFFIDTNTVTCEKVYDVRLSAETVEIDINDIPDNREVEVGINIDNNPGMQSMGFWIRKDSRLSCDEIRLFEFDRSKRSLTHGFYDNMNVIEVRVVPAIDFENGELTYENGMLLKIKLVLPENINSGDYFEVKPVLDYTEDPGMDQAGFFRENSFEAFFGRENFADPVAGGIKITGSLPEPTPLPSPSPSPSPKPSSSPSSTPKEQNGNNNENGNNGSGNNENGNTADNKTTESQTSTAMTSAVSEVTSVSESETLPVSTVSETVTSLSVTETEIPETSIEETTVTTEVTKAVIEVDKEERSKTYLAAVAAAAIILIAAALLIVKKNNSKN